MTPARQPARPARREVPWGRASRTVEVVGAQAARDRPWTVVPEAPGAAGGSGSPGATGGAAAVAREVLGTRDLLSSGLSVRVGLPARSRRAGVRPGGWYAAALGQEPGARPGGTPASFDLNLDDIPVPQPRLPGATLGDPGRRPRGNDVARLEGEVRAAIAHQLRDPEDHVCRAAALHLDPVDAAGDVQRLRVVDLVGGDHVRSQGQELVGGLAEQPLAAAELQVPDAEVVRVAVPEDVSQSVRRGYGAGSCSNDDAQLGFVVELLGRAGRQHDVFSVAGQGVGELAEDHRLSRQLGPGLLNVAPVVQADADDLSGSGDARRVHDGRGVEDDRAGQPGRQGVPRRAAAVDEGPKAPRTARGFRVDHSGPGDDAKSVAVGRAHRDELHRGLPARESGIAGGEVDDSATALDDVVVRGREGDPHEALGGLAERAPRHARDAFLLQEGQRQVAARRSGAAEIDHRVEGSVRPHGKQAGRAQQCLRRAASPPVGVAHHFRVALGSGQRRERRGLRHGRRAGDEGFLDRPREPHELGGRDQPAQPPPRHGVGLRDARDADDAPVRILRAGGDVRPVEDKVLVNLVADDPEVVLVREAHHGRHGRLVPHGPGRVRRVAQQEHLGPRGQEPGHLRQVGAVAVSGREPVGNSSGAGERRHAAVVRPSRVGHEHLVASVEQRERRSGDGVDRPVRHQDLVRGDVRRPLPCVPLGDRGPERRQAERRRVPGSACQRSGQRRLDDVVGRAEARLPDLEVDNPRERASELDDLSDAGPRHGLSGRRQRLQL
ncbi:hypothetical protein MMC24_007919 [Lignoscripta atroalba]|nr:hypothetical protein [Lignoscripta atroalba]